MEITREKIYELGREKFVTDIVSEFLKKDELDDNKIKEVLLDDHGNCIHISFTGGVSASTIIAIGEAFGDDDPNMYGEGENTIKIVFVNEKYNCLIDDTETDD